MTNEEINKLVKLQQEINSVETDMAHLTVKRFIIRFPSDGHELYIDRIPGLREDVEFQLKEQFQEHLDELKDKLNKLVLCTEDKDAPTFKKAEL